MNIYSSIIFLLTISANSVTGIHHTETTEHYIHTNVCCPNLTAMALI